MICLVLVVLDNLLDFYPFIHDKIISEVVIVLKIEFVVYFGFLSPVKVFEFKR